MLFASPATGQTVPDGDKVGDGEAIKVLPVGSFRFSGAPGFNDPQAEEQQAEIKAVVDSLLAFRPTKVAIERERKDSTYIDSLRAGETALAPHSPVRDHPPLHLSIHYGQERSLYHCGKACGPTRPRFQ